MQMKIRFPFSLRGIPIGTRTEKYIHASYDLSCQVAEVDPSEAPVVATTRHGYLQDDWETKFNSYEGKRTEVPIVPMEMGHDVKGLPASIVKEMRTHVIDKLSKEIASLSGP
ncbi:hypothetical protein HFN89_01050 [Rhizobium laguerreae]|nr:hypothetical protein [Rhizobium laguerreae]